MKISTLKSTVAIATKTRTGLPAAVLMAAALIASAGLAAAGDWPQWCGRPDRNMVSDEKGLPDRFDAVSSGQPDAKLQNVKWVVRLGGGTFGSPVIAGGKVYVGGSADYRNTAMLWCFRESDGKMLWRMRSPFCRKIYNRTWGICSTPTVEGDRVYLLGHLGEVLCLDANGLAGGPPSAADLAMIATDRECVKSEIDPDGRRILECSAGTPGKPEPTDAHIVWSYDMLREVNCWPFNAQSPAVIVRGDRLYVATGTVYSEYDKEGSRYYIEQWKSKYGKSAYVSPSLIVLDKNTGKLLAEDKEGIFETIFHGAHASPAWGTVNGKELLIYGAGNGTCYAFDPDFEPGKDGRPGVLKLVWKFDCLAASSYDANYTGPRLKRAEIMATPVFYKNRVYVSIGNDLSGKTTDARLICLDATKSCDITATGRLWSFDEVRNTSSTVAIADGLLYTADSTGNVYCLDAETGKPYWQHQVKSPIWSSPLVCDGKVYVTSRGLWVFAAAKEKKLLGFSTARGDVVASPAVANGVLYLATDKFLYALQQGAVGKLNTSLSPWTAPETDGLKKADKPKHIWRFVLAGMAGLALIVAIGVAVQIKRKRNKAGGGAQ